MMIYKIRIIKKHTDTDKSSIDEFVATGWTTNCDNYILKWNHHWRNCQFDDSSAASNDFSVSMDREVGPAVILTDYNQLIWQLTNQCLTAARAQELQ